MGYKGIGSNLGMPGSGIGESGPSGVSLTSKLQGVQPGMSEHASMPIMSTNLAQRFISQGGGQGPSAASGHQLSTGGGPSTDMIT